MLLLVSGSVSSQKKNTSNFKGTIFSDIFSTSRHPNHQEYHQDLSSEAASGTMLSGKMATQTVSRINLPSLKRTAFSPLKIGPTCPQKARIVVFQTSIFRCENVTVSFREGTSSSIQFPPFAWHLFLAIDFTQNEFPAWCFPHFPGRPTDVYGNLKLEEIRRENHLGGQNKKTL